MLQMADCDTANIQSVRKRCHPQPSTYRHWEAMFSIHRCYESNIYLQAYVSHMAIAVCRMQLASISMPLLALNAIFHLVFLQ